MPRLDRAKTETPLLPPVVPDKPRLTDRQPIALVTAIQYLALQVVTCLIGFGIVNWTDAQKGMVLELVGAVLIVGQSFAWGKVWSPASVARLMRGR